MTEHHQADSGAFTVPAGLLERLQSWRRPVVVGHVRPDADCLGAMFSVALTWPGDGSTGRVSLPAGSLSRRLAFLAEWADAPLAGAEEFASADGFVAVDTAKKPRCNVDKQLGDDWDSGRDIINIDHHASNTDFGAVNWVDDGAGSACELIYRLIKAADRPMSPLVASLLYAGIHSDTIGFSLPTTTASALQAAAELVSCGARVQEVCERLCRSQSAEEFGLDRVIYGNTKLIAGGRIAYSTASYDEIASTGCSHADIDDQISIPRALMGIRMAILFTEGVRNRTRLNLRGEAGTNVLDFAKRLGGGGHAQAAGAIIDGTIEQAVEKVLPLAIAELDGNAESAAPMAAKS